MSRTGENPLFHRAASTALAVALFALCRGAPASPLVVTVQQRDGKPLAGAVLTADPQGLHLPPPAPVNAMVDQVDLAFVPDVILVPAGSSISFPNSDAVSHQVYSFSSAHRFQLPLYRGRPYPPQVFDQPGVITLGCNIHDNMVAYVIVTAAPFFGRTDAHGAWTVANLPSGRYRVQLWHPRLNEPASALDRVVEVTTDGAQVALRLGHALKPAPLKSRPNSWDY
jgi:plastocyanin